MTFSTSFSANRTLLVLLAVSVLAPACAAVPVKPQSPQGTASPLKLLSLSPDRSSPQAAEMATVRWTAEAAGGAASRSYEFRISDGKGEKVVASGPSPSWEWAPREPGIYRLKAVVRDSLGHMVESGWSSEYVVVPKLVITSLSPDRSSPQSAMVSTILWTATTDGGVGIKNCAFWLHVGGVEKVVQSGSSTAYEMSPRNPGTYRVRVVVHDSLGNAADSGWSSDYVIAPPLDAKSIIAVMPMENLTGTVASVKELRRSLLGMMRSRGFNILDEDVLEKFMEKHRVRYTGGLNGELGEAFRTETGTKAVLFVALEQYDETVPPKISLVFRLVSAGGKAAILWVDSVDMAGNDAPGILGLGFIRDPRDLWKKAIGRALDSLARYETGTGSRGPHEGQERSVQPEEARNRFRPRDFYGALPTPPPGKDTVSIAVLPFINESTRRNAGEVMALHFVEQLSQLEHFEVVELGVVRQSLLMSRTIMEGGLSLPQADLLRTMLNVDLILTGNVMDYQDYSGPWGAPTVDFSTRVFDMKKRQVVWASVGYNRGDDGVYFFNIGKVNTAHGIATRMVRGAVERMLGHDAE